MRDEKSFERKAAIAAEIESIVDANPDGLLRSEDVVEYARNPNSALHDEFEWNDSEAAEKYRLQQARRIIQAHVTIVSKKKPERIRAYVSLASDRLTGGGYRRIQQVLTEDDRRAELLLQAYRELEAFKRRFSVLEELAELFEAMEAVKPK